jgi:O-antigen/teichoic acid export membrane protein
MSASFAQEATGSSLSWPRSLLRNDDVGALLKSASTQMMATVVNAGQSVLLPLMAGPQVFGLYAGLYTNMMVAVGIGRGPIELLVQRGHQHLGQGAAMIYRRRALLRVFLVAIALAVCLFVALSAVQRWPVSIGAVLFLTIGVATGAASGLRRGLLMTRNRTGEVERLDLVVRPALFLGAAGICWWLGVLDSVLIWLVAASFIAVLAWPNLKAVGDAMSLDDGIDAAFRPWSRLLMSNGLSILVKNADVIILGMYLDVSTVGRYYIVARVADLAAFGYSFATARFVHLFASARRKGDRGEVRRLISRAAWFGGTIAAVAATSILVVGPIALPLIDPVLRDYWIPLAILVAAQVINGTVGVQGAFLTAIDPRYAVGLKLVLNPIAIGAMLLAVPAFGPVGAAAVACLYMLGMQLANMLILRRILGRESAHHLLSGGAA